MESENYRQAWQTHSGQTRITIDTSLLLTEIQRSQRKFRAESIWRDYCMAGIAVLMLPLWCYMGVAYSLPWTWYLEVPAILWIVVFILGYRMGHQQRPAHLDESLLNTVKESLTQLEHQIWLLHNMFWWYVMPVTIPGFVFLAHIAWLARPAGGAVALVLVKSVLVVVSIIATLYFLKQRALRSDLGPRRQELLALLASLTEMTEVRGIDERSR